jgi:glutathione S-transferase
MKLYYTPGACSLSPHIVAKEAGLDLSLEKVDLKTHTLEGGADYYAINPKGYVPALSLDSGNLLTEGPAIVQYLADLAPDSGLLAAVGTFERYKTVEWLAFINGEIHKSFSPLFRDPPADVRAAATDKIQKRFAQVTDALKGNDYLMGKDFSVADAYLYVMLRWSAAMKIDVPPALEALSRRIAARPKVQEALKEEGLA